MKIDTSFVNLSSTREYTEKKEIKIERESEFSNLFDNRLIQFQPGTVQQLQSAEFSIQWFELTTFNDQPAIELSDQFVLEIEKLQQMFDSILEEINRIGRGGRLDLARIDRVNINPRGQPRVGMVEYEYTERQTFLYHETENTNFFADGIVKTKDGRTIDFSFELGLDREFFREDQYEYTRKGYALIDPLVINLDNNAPQLAETYFSFDLDMDGVEEELPALMPGSGLLVFDKNQDGIVNDGSELFGPSTGNGFEELSQYDLDNNFWIDENDAIFDELSIWESDEHGEMHLTRIKEAGIGAIYLVNVDTPFDLRDENNDLDARIKRSGIALNEDGTVSSVQEIDWTV